LDHKKVIPAHIVTTLLNGAELIRMVCSALGVKEVPKEKDDALARLRLHLESLYQEGRKALVIIDEAQNLSVPALEELRMLSNFQVGRHAPCQIFLVGQPQFRDAMSNPNLEQLRQRVIAAYHLGPLVETDCAQYITHRLRQVGWKGDPVFSPDAIASIYRNTDGVPRRINTLCSRLLLLGFLDDLHTFAAEDVERVAADLREEQGVTRLKPSSAQQLVANGEENYLSRSDDTFLRRPDELDARLDAHEKSIRHIFRSLARMVDPEWLDRR
jgi:type II secretory pathway predicted ATPase ExeA